ncbi:MAG: hypothetical protein K0S29_633 [Gammaproteobacteria bacterium]|jgi:hypothetical protein|nr:hypothetical protein [Gammaproteobacteria bacterium]
MRGNKQYLSAVVGATLAMALNKYASNAAPRIKAPEHESRVEPIASSASHSTLWSFYMREMAIGVGSGAIAGFLCYPGESLKKRYQSGQIKNFSNLLFALKPRELWRGASGFTASVGLTSMVQVCSYAIFKKLFAADENLERWAAVPSGAFGALASTAVESCILNQQKLQSAPFPAYKYMITTNGKEFKWSNWTRPWTGLSCIGIRELVFGYSMLEGADMAVVEMQKFCSRYAGSQESAASLQESLKWPTQIGYGILMSLATHPFDTLATKMQDKLHYSLKDGNTQRISAARTAYEVFQAHGLKEFWKGAIPRAGLFTGCMIIAGSARKALEPLINPNRHTATTFKDGHKQIEKPEENTPR